MKKKILYSILIVIICLAAGYFFASAFKKQLFSSSSQEEKWKLVPPTVDSLSQNIIIEPSKNQDASSKKSEGESSLDITKKIEQTVPFIVQAPFGNWSDPDFQNACEEASMTMAMGWVKGEKTISSEEAQKRILAIIDFENKTFGYSTGTNAEDVERIFREYFRHENAQAQDDITISDIKAELQKGRVVIIPAFGQALDNPNFTQPGPVTHMLLVIGYDPLTRKFITNDPGTRKGAGYRYDESVLFDAIWEYPSGASDPPYPEGIKTKAFISIGK